MDTNHNKEIWVTFLLAAFSFNRTHYVSAELQAAAEAGDGDALRVIAQLIEVKASIIKVETLNPNQL